MEIDQSRDRNARRSHFHASAGDRVQHPRRQDEDGSRPRHEVDEAACLAQLTRFHAKPPAVKSMPAIVDDDFLPDMGRMTG